MHHCYCVFEVIQVTTYNMMQNSEAGGTSSRKFLEGAGPVRCRLSSAGKYNCTTVCTSEPLAFLSN